MRGHHAGFQRLLLGRLAPGVWSVGSLEPGAAEVADGQGWRVFRLQLDDAPDQRRTVDRLASSMDLSDRRWDTAHELLTDRPWTPGARALLLVEGADDASPQAVALRRTFDEAARFWMLRGVGFFVVWVGATSEPRLDYWTGLDDPGHPPMA